MKYVIRYTSIDDLDAILYATQYGLITARLSDAVQYDNVESAKDYLRRHVGWLHVDNAMIISISEQELFKAKLADV